MGKNKKKVTEFIESIPDAKLQGIPTSIGLIFKDTDFRLDMQGMTTERAGQPRMYNLQVQINNETTITSLKRMAPNTVAKFLASERDTPSAAAIKAGLIDSIMI